MKILSIIIPVFNERGSIEAVLRRVESQDTRPFTQEIIVVDDGSTDGSREIIGRLESGGRVRAVYHSRNRGKGAALKSGLAAARGEYLLIQDADFEYDPQDYRALLRPILDGPAQIVFGSRNLKPNNVPYGALYFYGGRLTTMAFNIVFGTAFTDIHTGYKLFPRQFIPRLLSLPGNGFVFDAVELTYELAAGGRVVEVPIRYRARSRAEGKKLNWRDGFKCLAAMIRIALFGQSAPLGRWFKTGLWLLAGLGWLLAGLFILGLGPPPLGTLEELLKGPIFLYYYTLAWGWIPALEGRGLLRPMAVALALSIIYASIRGRANSPLGLRWLGLVLPAAAIVLVLVLFYAAKL